MISYENFSEPQLLSYFEAISAIPRASYHEQAIADWLVAFAKERGLFCHRDECNNVLINLPATPGKEELPPLLLQGHTDMVCEKNADSDHNFDCDPLELYEEDGWIRARGTTLGADDGVAVAAMLAILDGAAVSHPEIQCLLTPSEEVGLDGVNGFDYSLIRARRLINMDSADEQLVIVGCAGGLRSDISLTATRKKVDGKHAFRITVKGLAGGHSGEDIHLGRANANKVMGRVLDTLSRQISFSLADVNGGSKTNAIPREAEAMIVTDTEADTLNTLLAELEKTILAELVPDDRGFVLQCTESAEMPTDVLDDKSTAKVIFLMLTVANGVFAMNSSIPGLVEYSRNMGVVKTDLTGEAPVVTVSFSSRSALESRVDASARELDAYAVMVGAESNHHNRYPGWNFSENSDIRARYGKAYRDLFGEDITVTVIHAGLECGIISEKLPGIDIISCGPDVRNLHSPDEKLNKASFARFFAVIRKVIEEL